MHKFQYNFRHFAKCARSENQKTRKIKFTQLGCIPRRARNAAVSKRSLQPARGGRGPAILSHLYRPQVCNGKPQVVVVKKNAQNWCAQYIYVIPLFCIFRDFWGKYSLLQAKSCFRGCVSRVHPKSHVYTLSPHVQVCEFEGQKRAFPRGKPGIFGRNFPEISGKIREIRENPGNSGNLGISQTTNLRNIQVLGQNRNFHHMCAGVSCHIFVCFSPFTQIAFTQCVQCKNTQLNIDLHRCKLAENCGEMCVYTNYI